MEVLWICVLHVAWALRMKGRDTANPLDACWVMSTLLPSEQVYVASTEHLLSLTFSMLLLSC